MAPVGSLFEDTHAEQEYARGDVWLLSFSGNHIQLENLWKCSEALLYHTEHPLWEAPMPFYPEYKYSSLAS